MNVYELVSVSFEGFSLVGSVEFAFGISGDHQAWHPSHHQIESGSFREIGKRGRKGSAVLENLGDTAG